MKFPPWLSNISVASYAFIVALILHIAVTLFGPPFVDILPIVVTSFDSGSAKQDVTIDGSQKLTNIHVSLAKP